jgi:hypothetical protein
MTVQKLALSPWKLATGTSVFAKIIGINAMGESSYSTGGNGAVIKLSVVPDAPISLARDDVNTWEGQITLTWADGVSNGGQTIDYYRVSHDQASDSYIVVATQVTEKTHTVVGLTAGLTYRFKVEAHNAIGHGAYSSAFGIIAATNPGTP